MNHTLGNPLDLRAWLRDVEALGELTNVNGADWNLELGAISELNVKKASPRALLFDEIPGYRKGFRVLTCSTSGPARLSSILRLPIRRTHRELVDELRGKPRAWQAQAAEYDPVAVHGGPVFENVQRDAEVDVLTFPAPFWHELDGGRYIGTGCSVVTKDLDSEWVNVGTYRAMVHDSNHVGIDMVQGKHGRIQYEKYKKAGRPFPVAIVLGADPLGYLISGIEIPFGSRRAMWPSSPPAAVVPRNLEALDNALGWRLAPRREIPTPGVRASGGPPAFLHSCINSLAGL